jgi:hypothetical protein
VQAQIETAGAGPRARTRTLAALGAAILFAVGGAPAFAQTHTFAWKVTKGPAVVYLVGSVHVLTKDYYPLSPALENAYKDSALVVEEVDMGQMMSADAQMQMLGRGMLTTGQTLDEVLTPATRAMVARSASDLGVPAAALQMMKPWMAALTLDALEWQMAGFDPNLGLDMHFYATAKADNKPVQGLETFEYQMALFDNMSIDQQDHLLAETLKELNTEQDNLTATAQAWKVGDVPAVERIVLEDLKNEPAMYQRLLVDRNRAWLPKIEALFSRPRPSFVVVGAAHLIGPDGLLQALTSKGYHVEQQ